MQLNNKQLQKIYWIYLHKHIQYYTQPFLWDIKLSSGTT